MRDLNRLASQIEFGGILDALEVQLEAHGESLTEEQLTNWQKIVFYGREFLWESEDLLTKIAAQNLEKKRLYGERARHIKKIHDLQQEMTRLKRINNDLNETLAKGFRV